MAKEPEVVFPQSMRDLFPTEAQRIYIETYKQSWAKAYDGTSDQMSLEGVAARDAWEAVKRQYSQDPVTHKWGRIDGQTLVESHDAGKQSFMDKLKRLFKG